MRRRLVLVLLTVVGLAVATPVSVLVATQLGAEPTHWSGVRLTDVESPLPTSAGDPPPEAAALLLDRARLADESDSGDLAPSWWDASAGQVVLGAVTARGEQMRLALAQGQAPPYRIELRARSSRELTDVMHRATELDRHGVTWTVVDAEGNRVLVGARRLNHDLFTAASRYRGAVAIVYAPFEPETYLDGPPPDRPSFWSRTDPPAAWLTLMTGFPWYAGAMVVIVGALWAVPWLSRRNRRRVDATEVVPSPGA
jgi:hypothetical protein